MKAQWKEGVTYTVDNIRGQLLDASGYPFILFGSYIYGVTTDIERAVPQEEIPFGKLRREYFILDDSEKILVSTGMNWIGPYLSEAKGHTNETWSIILAFLDRFPLYTKL